MATSVTLPPLSTNEFNAILAGLRAVQHLLDQDTLPSAIREILTAHGQGLGLRQIDELCEKITFA